MRIVLALLACWFTWSLTFALSSGFYPLGSPDRSDGLVFFTPFLGLTLWLALGLMAQGRVDFGLWVFAISPILGAINYFLYIVFSGRGPNFPSDQQKTAYILAALWTAPFLVYLAIHVRRWLRGS